MNRPVTATRVEDIGSLASSALEGMLDALLLLERVGSFDTMTPAQSRRAARRTILAAMDSVQCIVRESVDLRRDLDHAETLTPANDAAKSA